MSATAKKKKGAKKRAVRATSNVFAQFDQTQIQEFKEAFNMIDQNRDGFVDMDDLKDMWASLGQEKSETFYADMMGEASGPINFTMFLTLFADKLNGTDPEEVIRNAFGAFDPDGTGKVHEDLIKNLLMTMGDRFSEEEFDQMCIDAPLDDDGNIDYVKYTRTIKHGSKEESDTKM